MSFYGQLAPYYDRLFPGDPTRTSFLLRLLEEEGAGRVLDAGCGTGGLLQELAEADYQVMGLEPDPEMARAARARLGRPSAVRQLTLQEAGGLDGEPFDALLCLGNTLAHLLDRRGLRGALEASRRLLRPGGLLVAQTVNFDRWLEGHWNPFPDKRVETPRGELLLRRDYRREGNGKLLRFALELRGKDLELKVESRLRPWRAEELREELDRAGFRREALLGNWSEAPAPSPAAITIARVC